MDTFELIASAGNCSARRGKLRTEHGVVETPVFMPVGTQGSVKGLTPKQIKETGAGMILANTYHMMIRPGVEVVEALGDLHGLMGWDGPILTDSGGYQVFSLSQLNRIGDDGVEFSSHVDGAKMYLDPKTATIAQNRLGADVIMCFDECAPFPCERKDLAQAVDRTIRWAKLCKEAHSNDKQLLFGIVQGGIDLELRSHCVEKLCEIGFDGYAIGGLSVGEGYDNMIATTIHTVELLPKDKPRYLMGVGMPVDIVAAVRAGIDMFDCVLPTRNGRNGYAFTKNGPVKMRNNVHVDDAGPVEESCKCYCCENFSRGALRHFFKVGEMLGPILLSMHNITFYQELMSEIRTRIEDDTFAEWADEFIKSN